MIHIRLAEYSDIPIILSIFDKARRFMRENGNLTQWAGGYPARADVEADIDRGVSYVVLSDGKICGTFALIPGDDPTYRIIENGAWRKKAPYAVIHRIASDGTVHGLAAAVFAFASERFDYIRIDTHEDNHPMQHAAERFGFQRCGIIHVRDGSPRIAFDYYKE